MRRLVSFRTALIWAALVGCALSAAEVDPRKYLEDVKYLASPELRGRATGSPELEKAGEYLAAQYKSFGLKPPDGKSFEQAFPVTLGAHLGTKNSVEWNGGRIEERAFSFSSSGSLRADVVFAGYGITDKEKNYDDYSGIDVSGKFVLLLRHEPREAKDMSSHAALTEKAVNAKMH